MPYTTEDATAFYGTENSQNLYSLEGEVWPPPGFLFTAFDRLTAVPVGDRKARFTTPDRSTSFPVPS